MQQSLRLFLPGSFGWLAKRKTHRQGEKTSSYDKDYAVW
jgi:hypothetical protein